MSFDESLGFDLYGTLVDPIRISTQLESYLPHDALRVAEIWRQKQLEFTFRLTVMEQYRPFDVVTRMALDYALLATRQHLDGGHKDRLMAQYNELDRFEDVVPALGRLRDAHVPMVVFSNGNPSMLEAMIAKAELTPYFQGFVSVDEVQVYKPSPQAYHHLAKRLGRPVSQVRLISSNPFDLIGAQAAGLQAAWIDRSGGLYDDLGPRPTMVATTLVELVDMLLMA